MFLFLKSYQAGRMFSEVAYVPCVINVPNVLNGLTVRACFAFLTFLTKDLRGRRSLFPTEKLCFRCCCGGGIKRCGFLQRGSEVEVGVAQRTCGAGTELNALDVFGYREVVF